MSAPMDTPAPLLSPCPLLPPELLLIIINNLPVNNLPKLSSVALASSTLRHAAQAITFKNITIQDTDRAQSFTELVQKNLALGLHVRSTVLNISSVPPHALSNVTRLSLCFSQLCSPPPSVFAQLPPTLHALHLQRFKAKGSWPHVPHPITLEELALSECQLSASFQNTFSTDNLASLQLELATDWLPPTATPLTWLTGQAMGTFEISRYPKLITAEESTPLPSHWPTVRTLKMSAWDLSACKALEDGGHFLQCVILDIAHCLDLAPVQQVLETLQEKHRLEKIIVFPAISHPSFAPLVVEYQPTRSTPLFSL
ncbi:hypothetical protein C8F01DRAFT_1256119 [Mycena amicta]|nr:hypothetical protein C8F01DRAFT_1256119 [Mycena amicta]